MKYLLLLLICIAGCGSDDLAGTIETSGSVISIADGDTFTLLTPGKKKIKVRLHGIDCPERKQDFGQVAKQKLSDLIFGQQVRIEKRTVDRYERTVAIVYDRLGRCINEEMLRSGLAWHYTRYDTNSDWNVLEENARKQRIGLWSHDNPIPPWEWRRK